MVVKNDLCLNVSFIICLTDALLTWHTKEPNRLFAVCSTIGCIIYIPFSNDLCCTHTSYSHMLLLMDILGILITKNKLYSMHLRDLYS